MRKRIWLIAGIVPMLTVLVATAEDIPSHYSTCTLDDFARLYICPDGFGDCPASDFCVNVRNQANRPINNAIVEVLIAGQNDGYVGICPDQTLMANTDTTGTVCFNIAGGGCLKHHPDAVAIRANGVMIRVYDAVMSSDYAGWDDDGIPGRWDHLVNPQDLAAFAAAYQGGTGPQSCHDYNNYGMTDPPDLAVFVEAYKGGMNKCP